MNFIKSVLLVLGGLIGATVVLWIWRLAVGVVAGVVAKYVVGVEFIFGAIIGVILAIILETVFEFVGFKKKRPKPGPTRPPSPPSS